MVRERWRFLAENRIGHRAALLVGWQIAALGFDERVHFLNNAGKEISRQHMIQCGKLSGEGWRFKCIKRRDRHMSADRRGF